MKEVLWTDDWYITFFGDGTFGISDGVGYTGGLDLEEAKSLYLAMKKYFESEDV